MPRSLKKGPVVSEKLYKKISIAKKKTNRRPIKTYSRGSTIIPEMVGLTIAVHTGKSWTNVFISEDLVGHKLGEFAATRQFKSHAGGGR